MAAKRKTFCVVTQDRQKTTQDCKLTFAQAIRQARSLAGKGRVSMVTGGGDDYRSRRPLLVCSRFLSESDVRCSSQPIYQMARSYKDLYAVEGDPAAGVRMQAAAEFRARRLASRSR